MGFGFNRCFIKVKTIYSLYLIPHSDKLSEYCVCLNFPNLRVFFSMVLVMSYAIISRRKSEDTGGYCIMRNYAE